MPDVLSVRETVSRAKADGMNISEYALRQWIRNGEIPSRKAGQKILIYYPNVMRYLRCENGANGR